MVKLIEIGVVELTDCEDKFLVDDYCERTKVPEELQGLPIMEIFAKLGFTISK